MPDTPRTATPAEITALVGYLEHQLAIPECAQQSGLSQHDVTELLDRHHITRRPGDTGTPQAAAESSPPPSSPGQPPHPALTAAAASSLSGRDARSAAPQAAGRASRTSRRMAPEARPARTATRPAPPPAPAHQAPAAGLALAQVRFVTIAEVAVIMRVSKMTVYRLVHDGELDAVRVGRSFRVPEQAVTSYLRGAFMTQDGHEP
jgi:excisionase family DNA binding protein